ncbi:MAG TPA: VOC family protein, partial [Thermoanaerobaculia bacterium]|nr:VOC family protein [Thermoanaerobaculia bacterium]
STASLDDSIARLKERGVTVTRPPAEEFTGRSAEILDPDGYRVILFQASELHPDEEWVPSSGVDELVKQKIHARRKREQARATGRRPSKSAAKKKAPKKAPKKAARKPARRKAAPKKTAPKKKPARRR